MCNNEILLDIYLKNMLNMEEKKVEKKVEKKKSNIVKGVCILVFGVILIIVGLHYIGLF